MKDRAHKAGTLALTSGPPLQTSFNLWEADKFLSVFLAQVSPDAVQFAVEDCSVEAPVNDAPTRQARGQ
jgi:hypothetical protein